ncbi:alginate lyase family protein [Bordetella sp. 02P26C-1]|uniref:alginate lyase family protein n=1 Tax=Bordetella sp. 02P26C-1 TaxID=2683195 RepID=UPI001365DEBF
MVQLAFPQRLFGARCVAWVVWLLIEIFPAFAANAATLESPWDSTTSSYGNQNVSCPTGVAPVRNIKAFKYYEDDSYTVDPAKRSAYLDATRNARTAAKQVVELADTYRAAGDTEVARCASRLLLDQAKGRALTGKLTGNQAELFRAWILNSYATAWLKVRHASGLDSNQQRIIVEWLVTLAEGVMRFHSTFMPKTSEHNLRYWAGLAVINAGIAGGRPDLYEWGVQWARHGINSIRPDGTLPQELKRGARALRYHLFALQPLIAIAEIAWINGDDLYSLNDNGLYRLVNLSLDGLNDPRIVQREAGVKQLKQSVSGTDLEWLVPFANRFPDAKYNAFLKKYPIKGTLYLGGKLTSTPYQ